MLIQSSFFSRFLALTFCLDLELENDVDEVLEKIDDNLSPAKEDADIKRGSGNEVEVMANGEQRKKIDRIPSCNKYDGLMLL